MVSSLTRRHQLEAVCPSPTSHGVRRWAALASPAMCLGLSLIYCEPYLLMPLPRSPNCTAHPCLLIPPPCRPLVQDSAWAGAWKRNAQSQVVQVHWEGAEDDGVGLDYFELCVGLEPFSCSLSRDVLPADALSYDIILPVAAPLEYHVSLMTVDRRGYTARTSTMILFDTKAPTLGAFRWAYEMGTIEPMVTSSTQLAVEIVGGPSNGNGSAAELSVIFTTTGMGGKPPHCLFERRPSTPSEWSVFCAPQKASHMDLPYWSFCIEARAVSATGLSSPGSTICLTIDRSAPTWQTVPRLVVSRNSLFAEWEPPVEEHAAGDVMVEYTLCSHAACETPRAAGAHQTSALLHTDLSHPRSVWLTAWATNRGGLRSANVTSEPVYLGLGVPSSGTISWARKGTDARAGVSALSTVLEATVLVSHLSPRTCAPPHLPLRTSLRVRRVSSHQKPTFQPHPSLCRRLASTRQCMASRKSRFASGAR